MFAPTAQEKHLNASKAEIEIETHYVHVLVFINEWTNIDL